MFVALGMPSQFSVWGFEVLRRIVACAHGEIEGRWIDRFDPMDRGSAPVALVQSYFPSRALSDAFRAKDSLGVLFTTPPTEAAAYQMADHGSSFTEALRTVGCSLALLQRFARRDNIVIVDQEAALTARAVVEVIARHFRIDVPEDFVVGIEESLGQPGQFAIDKTTIAGFDGNTATLVLGNAVGHLHDPDIPLMTLWPHRVFLSGDKPNETAPLVTDATGASRVLYYGPYFHLPEGTWQASLTLGFSKDAVGLPMKIAAYGPDLLGEASLRSKQEGIFAARFSFTVTEPEKPVELHVRTEEGAIEGRIALGQVELDWQPGGRPLAVEGLPKAHALKA